MDCNHARLLLGFSSKKAEFDSAEAEALQAHLEQCPECEQHVNYERNLDAAVGRAMLAVPVPSAAKARLKALLADRSRVRLRRTAAAAALAAAVLICVLSYGWFTAFGRAALSEMDLVSELAARAEIIGFGATPDQVDQWFASQGLSTESPRNFNYAFLKSADIARYQKRQVPKLVFARDDLGQVAMAEIYVLSDKEFDFASLAEKLETERELPIHVPGSRFDVRLMQAPGGNFLFLIILQGGALDAFLTTRPEA